MSVLLDLSDPMRRGIDERVRRQLERGVAGPWEALIYGELSGVVFTYRTPLGELVRVTTDRYQPPGSVIVWPRRLREGAVPVRRGYARRVGPWVISLKPRERLLFSERNGIACVVWPIRSWALVIRQRRAGP